MNEWFWLALAIAASVFVIASNWQRLARINPWTIIGWIVLAAIALYVGVALLATCAIAMG